MKIIIRQHSLDFKKESFNDYEKVKVPAELKKLEEDGVIGLTETSIWWSVYGSHNRLYLLLERFSRDCDIELV